VPDKSVRGMPPKLLRFSAMLSDQHQVWHASRLKPMMARTAFCEAGHAENDCEELSQNGRQDAETRRPELNSPLWPFGTTCALLQLSPFEQVRQRPKITRR
jgi:hypothetical protein